MRQWELSPHNNKDFGKLLTLFVETPFTVCRQTLSGKSLILNFIQLNLNCLFEQLMRGFWSIPA